MNWPLRLGCGGRTALRGKCIDHIALLGALLVGPYVAHVEPVEAQAFRTIYTFSGLHTVSMPFYGLVSTNGDGASPWCTLFLSGNTLYGAAGGGGVWGEGTLFNLKTDGSGFTNLHNFSLAVDVQPVNSDGINPMAGLTLAGSRLYGTAFQGGTWASGTVFSVSTNGDNFQTLHSFSNLIPPYTNSDGAKPFAELVVSGNVIYGSTSIGGPAADGTLFRLNADGSGFYPFDSLTNIGGGPPGALVLSSNVLYGTTTEGGGLTSGTVFTISMDGTGLTTLYSLTGGADGAYPRSGLLLSGDVLYGTTTAAGDSGLGTVFSLNIDGTGFATLHSFTGPEGTPNSGTLVLLGHNLFGIASIFPQGGLVYSLNTNGMGFTILHTFAGPGDKDGGQPLGGLTASENTLYGTTSIGGSAGSGTIFSISLLPRLTIIPSGQNVILTWPTNYAGFDYGGFTLQSTTNLSSPVWTTNLPQPVVINGQNIITNPISGTQQFFRLSQ